MPNLNDCNFMGNVTRDPVLKYLPSGSAVAEIGLAINHVYTTEKGEKREETTFLDIVFFGKPAETISEHVKKGQPLFVKGRLKIDQWDDRETGQKRSKPRIVGEKFQFLGGKPEQSSGGKGGQSSARPATPATDDDSEAPF